MTSKLKQKALTLTRPAFQAWLESKHPRSYIGTVGASEACPIAQYLKSTTGSNDVDVDGFQMTINENADYDDEGSDPMISKDLPKWAGNFVERIDNLGGYRVTAQRALKILQQSRSDGFVPEGSY